MPISIEDQYHAALGAVQSGDIDLLEKVLTNPAAISPTEHRTLGSILGLKRGFLRAAVDVVGDPLVWMAMFFAKKFPTSMYIKGTIPQRMIGSSNEFSGISLLARPVEQFFRGKNIPRLDGLFLKRQTEVMKVGNRIFDEILARPNWNKGEMEKVSLILEGSRSPSDSPDLIRLADRIRTHMNSLWDFLGKTHQVSGGFEGGDLVRASSRPFTPREAPRFLRDYLPHIPLASETAVMEIGGAEALQRLTKGRFRQIYELAGEGPESVWTVDAADRLSSNFIRYQKHLNSVGAKVFNERLFRRIRNDIPLNSEQGQELFITDLNIILQKYVHSVAKTYALNAPLSPHERRISGTLVEDLATGGSKRIFPTEEPIIVQIINEGLQAVGGTLETKTIAGTNRTVERVVPGSANMPTMLSLRNLVRDLKGSASEDQILFGNLFNPIYKTVDGLRNRLGTKKVNQLSAAVESVERGRRDREFTNRITSYFYGTTLGFNPLSTLKNLFQPFLTTAPALGIGPTIAGYKVLRQRVPQYASEFVTQRGLLANSSLSGIEKLNLALDKSFQKVFPELSKQGIRADPRLFEVSEADLVTDVLGNPKFRSFDAYNKFLLQPFTHSELSNQVVTFFGGKEAIRKALRRGEIDYPRPDGIPLNAAELEGFLNSEAGSLVNALQFKPGPGSRTVFQSMIPTPLRMFTSFPIRLGNFFAESTVRGALTEKQLQTAGIIDKLFGGRNLGTLARTFLYGKILNEGLRQGLGVDMSSAMGITGPFDISPTDRRIFSLPIPPIVGVVTGTVSALATRDIDRLQPIELPGLGKFPIPKVLVPLGIPGSRIVRAARQYRPELGGFVDDNDRLMYEGNTVDAVLAGLGIPLDKFRRTKNSMMELNQMRGQMREIKRNIAHAMMSADLDTVDSEAARFGELWPDFAAFSSPIPSLKDLMRTERHARQTSVQRMLTTFGKSGSLLEFQIYQQDPDLINIEESRYLFSGAGR